jgi:hypothetical protein
MKKPTVQCRWLLSDELDAVARLDFELSPDPWTADDLHSFLMSRNHLVQVAVAESKHFGDSITGALACCMEHTIVHVSRLLVPQGEYAAETLAVFGAAIRNKLNNTRSRAQILIDERETARLYTMNALGFLAVSVVRNQFGERDGILMVTDLYPGSSPDIPQNRISNYLEAQ